MADNTSAVKDESAPKGVRFLIRVWGAIAGICMAVTGLFVLITIHGKCLVAGIVQISAGLTVMAMEAPIFCTYFEPVLTCSNWLDGHLKFWMRGFLYLGFALPPFFLCSEFSTFLGCGAMLVLAAFYGALAIGKKGSASAVNSRTHTFKYRNDEI